MNFRKTCKERSEKRMQKRKLKKELSGTEQFKTQLTELKKNIRSFSLTKDRNNIGLSSSGRRVGESSSLAKYTDQEVLLCIDLRLSGMSVKEISRKMEIPVRTLRDFFSGRRRSTPPIRFKGRK